MKYIKSLDFGDIKVIYWANDAWTAQYMNDYCAEVIKGEKTIFLKAKELKILEQKVIDYIY